MVLSSKKKLGYLSDPKYMKYKGFELADTAQPHFELLYLPFDKESEKPSFNQEALYPANLPKGVSLYYTSQCPFTAKYVPLLARLLEERGVPHQITHIETREAAQNAPSPYTTFSIFCDGAFITHELPSEAKFAKLIDSLVQA